MNDFNNQLWQSQKDTDLPRWGIAYEQYFDSFRHITNVDKCDQGRLLQKLGVDYIVQCDSEQCYYFVDFMLKGEVYPNIWLEYQVNGKAGKFLKDEMLTTHIAYSHRSQTTVQMFSKCNGPSK